MNKYVILGDIHGRTIWKDIIEKESPDKIIFLGDYVSSHEGILANQQITNLEEILNYRKDNPNKVILLRGNHDLCFLGYDWAECSGFNQTVYNYMSQEKFKKRFEELTQWLYLDKSLKTVFSHAGISSVWLQEVINYLTINDSLENILNKINFIQPCELFGFTPNSLYDFIGDSVTQPLTWIRPNTLRICNIAEYNQVVGHTVQSEGVSSINTLNNQTIWLCDALGVKSYLTIENRLFTPTKL